MKYCQVKIYWILSEEKNYYETQLIHSKSLKRNGISHFLQSGFESEERKSFALKKFDNGKI